MGSGTSRPSDRPPKPNKFKRRLSTLVCGSSSSSSRSSAQTEDYQVGSRVNSAGNTHSVSADGEVLPKESGLDSRGGVRFNSPKPERVCNAEGNESVSGSRSFGGEQSSRDADIDSREVSSGVLSPLRNPRLGRAGDGETGVSDSSSAVPSAVLSSNVVSRSLEDDSIQEVMSTGSVTSVLDRIHGGTEGSVLRADVMSISSGSLMERISETSSREARRHSRRMFWDAFSSRGSRRNADFPTILFATDDADSVGSGRSWLLDFGSDIFDDGMSSDLWSLGRRSHLPSERRWHSRSEFWDRLRGGNSGRRRTRICPSGLHSDGSCLCGLEDEAGGQTSMSRIVMLAEALFEVLDELHHQPTSFALSMLSNPAPESTVDSLPIKSYEKTTAFESGDDVEQCYICLEEYEPGDKIRVLPCTHEYHTTCVDKWLKEIHGVCPLCRGDVSQGTAEVPLPDSGASSAPVDLT